MSLQTFESDPLHISIFLSKMNFKNIHVRAMIFHSLHINIQYNKITLNID